MLRKIVLHGKLKKLYPGELAFACSTVEEAISALCRTTKGAFNPRPGQGKHRVVVKNHDTIDTLVQPLQDDEQELHLFPALAGGKNSGGIQIIIGAIIVVAAIILAIPTGGGSLALGTSVLGGMTTAGGLMFAGLSMMAMGVLAMMSQAPKMDTPSMSYENNPDASKYLGAPRNTTRSGTRIPILYGRHKVSGHILSLNIDAKDVAV